MLGFLARLFSPTPEPAQPPVPERRLYTFWDGTDWRRVDPIATHAHLLRVQPDLDRLLQDAKGDNLTDHRIAVYQLLKAARAVFGLEVYSHVDGVSRGLTEGETFTVLSSFLIYMGHLADAPRSSRRA